ncbi:LacI family transcriptional regulator [Natroniella sulfidigena]|uniref:LacI family DNA-binding transcriptional regulator n=1 Tax=Natroniella sulfidigena TaxID=723921 RepID=UPI00200A2FA5|nr:LacI family DNA-binding transcriptional regulator [Natroniella sulfidigena]MCK8817720.1 LacI family transcriptional regulator [Natroniella sulfidigena]
MGLTIKEIAKLAGVSKSTVSRVINNSEHVSDEARKKVKEVVEKTGYVPSSIAKDLKNNQTDTIGVILPRINTSTFSEAVEGMSKVLYQNGYNLLLANTRLNKEDELEYLRLLKRKRVSGILFFATEITTQHQEVLEKLNIPVIILGQDVSNLLELPSVIQDDFQAAKDIVNYLIAHGHKRIAYIGVTEDDVAVGQLRKNGYQRALAENNLEVKADYFYQGGFDFSTDSGYQGMSRIIADSERLPTAVFAVTDRLAIGAMKCLREQGYRVPDDISVVGIGDTEMSSLITPELTTIRYDQFKTGELASGLLLDLIAGQDVTVKSVMDYSIIERESVKKI